MKNNSLNIGIEGTCLLGEGAGVERYTYNLIRELSNIDRNDKFHILYPKWSFLKKSGIDFKQHNIIEHRLPGNIENSLDLYHNTCGNACRQSKIKVVTVHDLSPLTIPDLVSDIKKSHFEKVFIPFVSSSDHIIATSNNTKKDIVKHLNISEDKISVIYEGVGEDFKPQPHYIVDLIKTRYGIKRKYILYAGSLDERKNIKGILEAFAKIKFEIRPELVIVGQIKNMKEALNSMAKKLGIESKIKYLGYIDKKDLPALYSGADALVWPSFYEGFGLPLLEAMSCSTAIITSKNSSIPEVVGNSAILIDPLNTDEIAASITAVITDEGMRSLMKQKSYTESKKFSARKMATETLGIYRKVSKR